MAFWIKITNYFWEIPSVKSKFSWWSQWELGNTDRHGSKNWYGKIQTATRFLVSSSIPFCAVATVRYIWFMIWLWTQWWLEGYRFLCYWWLPSRETLMWRSLVCITADGVTLHPSCWIWAWPTLIMVYLSSGKTWRAAVDAFPPFSHFYCAGAFWFVSHCLLCFIYLCRHWGGNGLWRESARCCGYLSLLFYSSDSSVCLFSGQGGNDSAKKERSVVMERVGDCSSGGDNNTPVLSSLALLNATTIH